MKRVGFKPGLPNRRLSRAEFQGHDRRPRVDQPDSAFPRIDDPAVTGGGLTVIANAPNPAGQALLGRFFEHGVMPLGLLAGALIPTVIAAIAFRLL